MAIEIRELRIKVTVVEANGQNKESAFIDPVKMNELKSEIVRDCTQRVLEKIKERQER
jgi:Family of unknown function (DUF5908)